MKRCCFTGHRPDKLYGFKLEDSRYQILAKKLREILKQDLIPNGVTEYISGGALGLDTISFFVVHHLKREYPFLKNIIAIPFEDQPKKWRTATDIDRYNRMLALADEIIYVDKEIGYSCDKVGIGRYHKDKLDIRNNYMIDTSDCFISVCDNSNSGTKNCINYAISKDIKGVNIHPQSLNITRQESKMRIA